MKLLLFVVFALMSSEAASNKLIMNNKIYTVAEADVPDCGTPGSPEYFAVVTSFTAGMGVVENMHKNQCQDGLRKDCDVIDFRRSRIAVLFSLSRQYPSRFRSEGCAKVREFCVQNCTDSGVYDSETCLVECNQYESPNR